jgi:uncharacterized protein YfaS (alpha-2-macroglobulin family)
MQKLLLMLLFLVFLASCNNQQENSESAKAVEVFNLETVKKQYQGMPLTVVDISEQSYENGMAIAVTLSVPLNPGINFQAFMKVSDKEDQAVKGGWILSANGLVAHFPNTRPSTQYQVDVFKGLTAATGAPLQHRVSQQLKTRKMPTQVTFASKGSVLPAKLAKGLPIISINVAEVDVDFHRIKAKKISHFLEQWTGRPKQGSYNLQKYAAYSDHVYSGRFTLDPPENQRYTTHLDLAGIAQLNQPGIYLAVMKQTGTYEYAHHVSYFVVTDLGLHARLYTDQMTVQVSSLTNGEAVSGVNLSLLDNKGKVLDTVITSDQGQGIFIAPDRSARVLLAENQANISLLKLNAPAIDLSEFTISGRKFQPLEIFTYGPRDLYRPGETVRINALLRDADGQSITAPPLQAEIKRPDGLSIKYFTWHAQQAGFYQTAFKLPDNARTGQWTLALKATGKTVHNYHFQVQAFLPERMELQLGEVNKKYWTDQTSPLVVAVSGQYLYGAPTSGNRLSSRVLVKPNRHPIADFGEYFFGDEDEKPPIEFFENDDIKLNEKGLNTLTISSRWQKANNSAYTIKIIGSLFESGGRPVTRSLNYTLWPQETLIGIRPQPELDNIPADTRINFELLKTTVKGKLTSGEVIASLIKERRDYYWEYSDAEGWHSEFTEKNFPVFEQRLTLNSKQASILNIPVEWGNYLLVIKDVKTGQISSLRFHAGSGWNTHEDESSARPDRVVLKLDKNNYQTNDTINLKITPPYAGNGFVVVENSNQPLWFQRLSIPAEGTVVSIPVPENWQRHDIYISTVVFRPGNNHPARGQEQITPNRAIGLIHLPLHRKNRKLKVEINAPDSAIRPETTLTTTLKISGVSPGKKTFVTLAAVDVGVLNITEFKTPNAYRWFFEPRRYGVEQHDLYHRVIELMQGDIAKPRFGGDADKHAGGARPDSAVKIVSLFSDLIEVDAQGMANIELAIPDFNGKLKLMALAFNENQFGTAENHVTVATPIIAEVSLPRFLAAGDKTTLTLDLRNQSGVQQTLSLKLQASSPIIMEEFTETLVLENQQKKILHLPLQAENAFGQASIQLSLTNKPSNTETIKLARIWHLGVRPAYPGIRNIKRQVVDKGQTIVINNVLSDFMLASASSQLTISDSPPINLQQQLKALLHYPYGCLEQTISSAYPWLSITAENSKSLGLEKIQFKGKTLNPDEKQQPLDHAIMRLAGMQRSNGSFGLWSNHSAEEHWLTVYAADFLLDARASGILVPSTVLDKALTRVNQYLNSRGNLYGERYSQSPGHLSFAYKAYAGYVLSRVNRATLGSLRTLYDHHQLQAKSGLPLIHLGLALYNQGDQKRSIQAIQQGLVRPRDDAVFLGDYGSRLRDLASMITLLDKQADKNLANSLVFQLADELNNRDHLSTQERNALFHAGLALMSEPATAWQGQLMLDNSTLKLDQTQAYVTNFKNHDIPDSIRFKSNHTQPLYLQSSLQGFPKQAPKMHMEMIGVERHYYSLAGEIIMPEQINSGDIVLVHVIITTEKRIKDGLLVELMPAGFELENQQLNNTLKTDTFRIDGKTIASMQNNNNIKYQQYLDDRFVAAIDLHKNQPAHLFYMVRAVTPGTYTNPPAYVEDMYRPYIRAIGRSFNSITIAPLN